MPERANGIVVSQIAKADPNALLSIRMLETFYGESHILHGVDLDIQKGEVVTLLGRNGVGKTTTLRAIMGMAGKRSGSIRYNGLETIRLETEKIARHGIAFCPEERGIFSSLNVLENLELPPVIRPGGMTVQEVLLLFPNLGERLKSQGTKLSGGEQQMLAIGRILRTGAELLLLDEPTEGLAPVIVQKIGDVLRTLKARGFTILLVEQNFQFASTIADRHYVMEGGKVVDQFTAAELPAKISSLKRYLGV
jgi:branched-chain amino acid transport system ATP-binding protein